MASGKEKFVISLPAVFDSSAILSEWLEKLLEKLPMQGNAPKVLIAADEIFTNISSYAYPSGTGDVSIHAEADFEKKNLTVTFIDRGIAFDPLKNETPDTTVPLEQRKIGGLGILVVQKMMDSVSYRREEDCNVLTITKGFDKE